ncbi:hypothetical protein [Streptomyces sp. A012304]|uniref:hypothetical protein n=1 Tax=Streptomyces sp. A012304 TaxID=375446 RepID=UPI002232018A|nr:hypothetical protein [Streptomyces sp. A012304]GKQ38497.1 hypothetical protein ALMP_50280 [Streptomyces sp. A012304]
MPPLAGPVFRLADYLEQHGRITLRHLCPPASFWHAAHTHLTHPDDLSNLTKAAEDRHRLQWGHHLLQRAADHGIAYALYRLAGMREQAGDRDGAKDLYRQASDHGDITALYCLAEMRDEAGDRDGAETLARQAADYGDTFALVRQAERNILNRLWPYGLDPDGTPTSPWQPSVSVEQSGHVLPGTS